MIFLDAYAVLALALDEPAAGEVEALIRKGEAAITAVNLFEAADYCIRRVGISGGGRPRAPVARSRRPGADSFR